MGSGLWSRGLGCIVSHGWSYRGQLRRPSPTWASCSRRPAAASAPRPQPQQSPARRRENLQIARMTLAFVGLGLLIRLVRFLVVYPIWHDEAFVAVNFLNRGYLDLLRPLDYYQACPILFLWIELTAVRLFGFSESALRLFPFICGLASVLLFRHVAARLFRGIPLLLAVACLCDRFLSDPA